MPTTSSLVVILILTSLCPLSNAQDADLILHHGKIVTVDRAFTVREAMAIKGGRILQVGNNAEILRTRARGTEMVDLGGKTVIPGLIDSHVHPTDACLTEFDHPIPDMETIEDVLDYIRSRASLMKQGEWINVRQVFITRLREQRYPSREELDGAAPRNPVVFSTGPDASLNTLALRLSGIDRDFRITDGGPGHIEKDPKTGEPTGILRGCTRYVKSPPTGREPSLKEQNQRLIQLFKDYNSVGLTGIGDRETSESALMQYRELHASGELTVRVSLSRHIPTLGPLTEIQEKIREVAKDPLFRGDFMLRIIGIKTYLDGGMLTGSAYMKKPWGVSKVYAITDPNYRGVLFIPKERLLPIVQTTIESGLQFTAHSQGDGAVHALLEVYEEINAKAPIRKSRPSITHSSFLSREAIEKLASLGVVVDLQPAWLYQDTRTLAGQFGYDRLRYFIPLRSLLEASVIAGGGSDHMQKIGSLRSINPYNPFLGIWVTLTRKAKWYQGRLHPEEALSREQAIRFYTINNAYILCRDDQVGSLEPGKLADLVVLDKDILTCPIDSVKDIRVLRTYLNGNLVFKRQ